MGRTHTAIVGKAKDVFPAIKIAAEQCPYTTIKRPCDKFDCKGCHIMETTVQRFMPYVRVYRQEG